MKYMTGVDILVQEYNNTLDLHQNHTKAIEDEIKKVVETTNILIHDISSRTKHPEKLKEKITRKGKDYRVLRDITDLSGVRVVCYFEKDVKKIAKVIEDNFKVIQEHTVDKYRLLNPDKFGYISLHYIISLPSDHRHDNEYSGLLCEVQIRSILQDAWAEIEHSLGYKASISVPKSIRRRFYRLAGLLELADDEFNRIKKDLQIHEKRVLQQLDSKLVNQQSLDIPIDIVSLKAYTLKSELIKEMDNRIVQLLDAELVNGVEENDINIVKFFDIRSIHQLNSLIIENESLLIDFLKEWSKNFTFDSVKKGITIFYLGYILALKTFDRATIRNYVLIAPIMKKNKEVVEKLLWKMASHFSKHDKFSQ